MDLAEYKFGNCTKSSTWKIADHIPFLLLSSFLCILVLPNNHWQIGAVEVRLRVYVQEGKLTHLRTENDWSLTKQNDRTWPCKAKAVDKQYGFDNTDGRLVLRRLFRGDSRNLSIGFPRMSFWSSWTRIASVLSYLAEQGCNEVSSTLLLYEQMVSLTTRVCVGYDEEKLDIGSAVWKARHRGGAGPFPRL